MPERRTLEFARLDDVMPEVDRLLAGHTTVGNWSLGQICNHLSRPRSGSSVEGFGVKAPWLDPGDARAGSSRRRSSARAG